MDKKEVVAILDLLSSSSSDEEEIQTFLCHPQKREEIPKIKNFVAMVSGFPGILGCIDGTSVPIVTPAKKIKSTYTNRHDIPAMTLQGICDANKKFINVFTGVPGKIHDSRVFKLSDISTQLPKECGANYHLLGDSAYYIREWLITPYRDYGNLTEEEKKFNKIHSSTRVLIENSFGLLKGRFRQLLQIHMFDVDKISKFIIACCVLHNLCIIEEDCLEDDEVINHPAEAELAMHESELHLRKLGEIKRNAIKERLCHISS
ncbi:hypothetical protein MML48_1g02433 [Holotrichia oblita]|uniref:Uncharacterized protein n=1 Tax=Holotrichia oblita TaxID=644536 RepID=A0ACB9TS18_HOLOL|nr:hypothetical protein MML48_1g02433 [Holotrichia oblita]